MRAMPGAVGAVGATVVVAALLTAPVTAQPPPLTPAQRAEAEARARATAEDHRDMLAQLGIRALRPGPSGNPAAPNRANDDERLANPHPDLPPVLRFDAGRPVETPADWERRRPEIVEHLEREVYGRVPDDVPAVSWTVAERKDGVVGGVSVTGRRLVGRVDNRAAPGITVEISLIVVTPAKAPRPVPLMIVFRRGTLPPAVGEPPPPREPWLPPPAPGDDPPAAEQLIASGWGYAFLDSSSVQPDNGAGLTRGIIGLTNRGRRRTPEQWGALRAWAWGASRALDAFGADPTVDETRVGIDGVSRYGKAALVTMAFDERFAVALIGSSGKGGTTLLRRHFGEAVENLTGAGEYHWMAGSFLKYGAEQATFGRRDAGDLPVDAHHLIALCAPRPVFISYGIPEHGDATWLDQRGSYMAAVAATPVYELLGATGLPGPRDPMTARMPPVLEGQLDGALAWRQHDGGHTDGPNWRVFIPWATARLGGRH